jgi:hypothetical protein
VIATLVALHCSGKCIGVNLLTVCIGIGPRLYLSTVGKLQVMADLLKRGGPKLESLDEEGQIISAQDKLASWRALWTAQRQGCVITIDRAGMAALRLRCIANSALNKKSNLQHVGSLLSHTP